MIFRLLNVHMSTKDHVSTVYIDWNNSAPILALLPQIIELDGPVHRDNPDQNRGGGLAVIHRDTINIQHIGSIK